MREVKELIIGAGISGLSYANSVGKGALLIEKEAEPGGYCRTFYQDDFVWDFAGHFFHFSTDKLKKFFDDKLSFAEKVVCKKNTKIFYKGTYIDYPFQMNIHQLPQLEFIDCLYDLVMAEKKKVYDDFLSMLYGKFGVSITEKFLKPYNEKLYACNLNMLEQGAMGRFFPYADLLQILKNMKNGKNQSYNAEFEYPKKGAVVFVDILRKNLGDATLECNRKLQGINLEKHLAEVDGEKIHYERLVSTIPLNQLVMLIEGVKKDDILPKLHANQVLVFNLGFDKKSALKDVHWLYFPDKDINFYRAGFYDVILSTDRLSMYVEIGYKDNKCITTEEINQQLQETLGNLRKCGIITDHKLIAYNTLVMNPAYVHITDESKQVVCELKTKLAKYDIYTIGRYGSWTYCSIEDCMLEANKLAYDLGYNR